MAAVLMVLEFTGTGIENARTFGQSGESLLQPCLAV